MSDSEAQETPQGSRYRGRFAPSPTGPLHLGSLLTALASFLQARSNQGEWLLRIDDIDSARSLPGAADAIRCTLERFGLLWDREAVSQQDRIDRYRQAIDCLQHKGLVYGCRCSRRILAGTTRYPGYCRDRSWLNQDPSHAVRVSTADSSISFTDHLHGFISQDLARVTGDFVVRRRDGVFAYHLVTVVDDADAAISEVLRGADLLDSTPRQIHLQQLLNLPTPSYCHTPVLVGPTGEKLSKQTFAASVENEAPGPTLCRLLRLLRQQPPAGLERAPTTEILAWAVGHWTLTPLRQLQTIAADAIQAAPPRS